MKRVWLGGSVAVAMIMLEIFPAGWSTMRDHEGHNRVLADEFS